MKTKPKNMYLLATIPFLWGCQSVINEDLASNPQNEFMQALRAHCGKSYAGRLVSADEADADMRRSIMKMQILTCTPNQVEVPFHVDEDHSRTWIFTYTENGLRLKHRHNHEDGSEDILSQYGGDTIAQGSAHRQEFPVDAFSKELFEQEGLLVSMTNVWAVEVTDKYYAYELRRKGRHFRVEFDLGNSVEDPPPPW